MAHKHRWVMQMHLDNCHSYTSTYSCADCKASLVTINERSSRKDPYSFVWYLDVCKRCTELMAGSRAKPSRTYLNGKRVARSSV